MTDDMTLVPGDQDRLYIRKVLVQGGPPNSCFFGDLRHSHRPRPMLSDQGCSGINNRLANPDTVRIYCLVPARHPPKISHVDTLSLSGTRRLLPWFDM